MFELPQQQLQAFLEQRQWGILRLRGPENSRRVFAELLGTLANTWTRGPLLRFMQPFEEAGAYAASLLEQLRAEWLLAEHGALPEVPEPSTSESSEPLLDQLLAALEQADSLPTPEELEGVPALLEKISEKIPEPPQQGLYSPDMPETLRPRSPATAEQVAQHWRYLRDTLPLGRPAQLSLALLPVQISNGPAFRRFVESLMRTLAEGGGLRRLRLLLLEPEDAPYPPWIQSQSLPEALALELTPAFFRKQLRQTLAQTAQVDAERAQQLQRQRVVTWLALGQLEQEVHAEEAAFAALQQGWREAQELGNAELECLALYQLAAQASQRGGHFDALQWGFKGLERARADGLEGVRVLLLLHLTELLLRAGMWMEAVELAHEGVLLTTLLGQLDTRHRFLARMGAGLQKLGKPREARACMDAAQRVRARLQEVHREQERQRTHPSNSAE
ncbi:MAG: hypothetical protein ACKO6N_01145 [Myxococcota bacterium]